MGFLEEVEKRLDLPTGHKSDVMRELAAHYTDTREELVASGVDESNLDTELRNRLGSPKEVAARLSAVHNTASLKSALLTAAPFAISAVFVLLTSPKLALVRVVLSALLAAVATAVSLVQIVRGLRPVWLSTWLAVALLCTMDFAAHLLPQIEGTYITANLLLLPVVAVAFSVAALAAVRRFPIWRWIVLASGLVYTACSLYFAIEGDEAKWMPAVLMGALWLVLLIYYARGVFEKHEYGNGFRASLFLFALFVLAFPLSPEKCQPVVWASSKILTGAAILFAIRHAPGSTRSRALWAAIFFWALGNSFAGLGYITNLNWAATGYPIGVAMYVVPALVCAWVLWCVVSIPVWCEDTEHHSAPPIVTD